MVAVKDKNSFLLNIFCLELLENLTVPFSYILSLSGFSNFSSGIFKQVDFEVEWIKVVTCN